MSSANLNNVYVGSNGRIQLSGLSSNIDFVDVVDQMMKARRIPADNLEKRIDSNDEKLTALRELQDLVKNLQTSMNTLYGANSFDGSKNSFSSKQVFATSSDGLASSLATVTASNKAVASNYTLQIDQVATKHKVSGNTINANPGDTLSTAQNGSGTAIGTGTFTVGSNGKSAQVDVSATDTLQDVRDKINAVKSTTNVQATIVKVADGQSTLIMSSTKEGAANQMTLSDDSGSILQNLGVLAADPNTGLVGINTDNEIQAGLDASFKLDGVTVTRSSNTIDDLVDGLTFDLYEASPSTTINISVEQNLSSAKDAILGFVDAYNAVRSYINEKTYVDPNTNEAGEGSVLLGNSSVKTIENDLQQILASTPIRGGGSSADDISVLAQVGLTFKSASEVTSDDKYSVSTLVLDEKKLNESLINNPDEVEKLFNFSSTTTNPSLQVTSFGAATGGAQYDFSVTKDASGAITAATYTVGGVTKDATINGTSLLTEDGLKIFYNGPDGATQTGTITTSVGIGAKLHFSMVDMLDSNNGVMTNAIDSLETQNTSYQEKIDKIDSRITSQREVMMNKFINMETQLAKLKNVQSSLDELMAAGKNNNN
jgi:flagellar hook-associated protein 2